MIQRQIDTPWGGFSVEDSGGVKPPVVFLHGGASNLRAWDNVIARLSDTLRCISFDLPAHGKTEIGPLGFAQLQEALLSAWSEMSISRPILVGHSFGGLASAFIGSTPGLASGVIAIDPYLSDKEVRRDLRNLNEALDKVRQIQWPWPDTTDVESEVERVMNAAYRPRPDEENLRGMIRRGYRPTGGGWFRRFPRREDELNGVRANWSVNVSNTFRSVKCPLSIVIATSIPVERLESRRQLVQEILGIVDEGDSAEFDCEHDIPGYLPDQLAVYVKNWVSTFMP